MKKGKKIQKANKPGAALTPKIKGKSIFGNVNDGPKDSGSVKKRLEGKKL